MMIVAIGHLGRAADHDPVFGAVVVHLQAQAGPGLDHDALDLVARAAVDAVVPAPGAVHLAVQHLLAALFAAELGDDVLHVLALLAAGHQHGVGRFHHDHVLQAHRAHQPAGGVHQRVAAVADDGVAHRGIALRVLLGHLPDGFPGAQVVPAGGQRLHADVQHAGALFHHRVVHRFAGHGGELGLARADELGVGLAHGKGLAAGGGDVGTEALQRRHPDAGLAARTCRRSRSSRRGAGTSRRGQVGLFDELGDLAAIGADVAVARLGPVGRDAQDVDGASGRTVHGALE
jgi:hypothetical protein